MSEINNTLPKYHFLFAQKKDPPPGLWDPLAGLFKKKVVPIEPIAPLPVEVPALDVSAVTEAPFTAVAIIPSPVEVPTPDAPMTPEVPVPEIPSFPESIPEIPLPPSSILDQAELLPAVGTEQEIQNIALDSIDATQIPSELPIAAAVSVISPIENPSKLRASFSRKVYGMLTLRNFTYLALLATAIAFIYLFYTRVWQKKTISQKEPTPPLEEKKVLLLEVPVVENLPQLSIEKTPSTGVKQEPKSEWLSKGNIGCIAFIGGFLFSTFYERRNRQSFEEELFTKADLKYAQLNAQFVTQLDLIGNTDFVRRIALDPQLAQAIQNEMSQRIDQIQQTIDQLRDLQQPNRDLPIESDLENLKEQLKELHRNVNANQFKKLGDTIAQLESRLNSLESNRPTQFQDLLAKLKDFVTQDELLERLKQVSEERDSKIAQLKTEITALIREESSKNLKFAEELRQLRHKIDQLNIQLGDFNPTILLERFEELKASSGKEREEAILRLKQEINIQLTENRNAVITQIRSEISSMQENIGSRNTALARELGQVSEQFGKLSSQMGDFNPTILLERFEELKASSGREREEAILRLKQEINIQLTENRDSIVTLMRREINTKQENEGSKNIVLARDLENLREQLSRLSSQMDSFEARKYLEKLEEVKNASTEEKEKAIALLRQEFAVQIQQAIFEIRHEFRRLNIENSQEISALGTLVERNYELGIIQFDEVNKLIEAIRSEDKVFVTSAIKEQSSRLDALQAKTQASILTQVQEMLTAVKINIEDRLSKIDPEHSSEVENLRERIPRALGENSDSIQQLESILGRLVQLENRESITSTETNSLIVVMKTTLQQSRKINADLVSLQERIQRNFESSLESEVRDLLRIMSNERILVIKQFSILENQVRDAIADIQKLRTEHNNLETSHKHLDSRFMRSAASTSTDASPNRLGDQRLTTHALARNLSSTSGSPSPAKDTSSQESREERIRLFRSRYSHVIDPHAQSEYTLIPSGDILKYLTGRTSVHWKYGVKIDQDTYYVKTDKIDVLADDFLQITPVTDKALRQGNPMALGAHLRPAAAQNLIANKNSLSQVNSTVTPERSRRLSLTPGKEKK